MKVRDIIIPIVSVCLAIIIGVMVVIPTVEQNLYNYSEQKCLELDGNLVKYEPRLEGIICVNETHRFTIELPELIDML